MPNKMTVKPKHGRTGGRKKGAMHEVRVSRMDSKMHPNGFKTMTHKGTAMGFSTEPPKEQFHPDLPDVHKHLADVFGAGGEGDVKTDQDDGPTAADTDGEN